MKNRDRRKVIAGVLADTAKYSLTAGVIGSIVSGNFTVKIAVLLGVVVIIMGIFSYFVTPEDKEKEEK